MSLLEHYQRALEQPDMVEDRTQRLAVEKLDRLTRHLASHRPSMLERLKRRFPLLPVTITPITGLYLWGGVGRGKTWLMNMFYDALPFRDKKRIHFHHFMLDIHGKLDRLNKSVDRRKKDPLEKIARDIASQTRIICIDEFIVTNITDAMILSKLLHALFDNGVCIVATSNRVPDDLYLNGLQRERFLPAIELIRAHMDVFNLDGGVDHRTALLEVSDVYYHPIDESTHADIERRLDEISITPLVRNTAIEILGRKIPTIAHSEDVAWFEFDVICNAPRAAQDYIELAQRYNTIAVSNIPVLVEQDDMARRFIYLIDELYDRNVKLIASALDAPQNLYKGTMLEFAFNRTSSRLVEMRSHKYLSSSHRPFKDEQVTD